MTDRLSFDWFLDSSNLFRIVGPHSLGTRLVFCSKLRQVDFDLIVDDLDDEGAQVVARQVLVEVAAVANAEAPVVDRADDGAVADLAAGQ